MKILRDLLTGKDNETHDLGRLCTLFGVLSFIFLEIYSVVSSGKWDPQTFGIGFATVMAGGGANLWLKKDTEPQPK